MTAHKPTPGPWRYSEEELWGVVYGASHELVATVLPGLLDKSKVVATARLIAAAPDMLDVLEALLVPLRDAVDAARVLERARLVVKKARGET